MPRDRRKFSPECKDEAAKAVIKNSPPTAQIARELGINEGPLGNWVAVYRREHADEEPALKRDEALATAVAGAAAPSIGRSALGAAQAVGHLRGRETLHERAPAWAAKRS